MEHKVILRVDCANEDSYSRGTLDIISSHSDSIVTSYTIWSDTPFADENVNDLNYHVFLESIPDIESLQNLEPDNIALIVQDSIESYPLTDLFKDADFIQKLIHWANKVTAPFTLHIPPSTLIIEANKILVDYMVCDIAICDVAVGITSEDLLNLANHVKNDWDIFSDTPMMFLKEIVEEFSNGVEFTSEQMNLIRHLQRVVLMDDNAPIVSSSYLYKDNHIAYQVLEHTEDNQSYYRISQYDYDHNECKILKYVNTLAEAHSFYEHYMRFNSIKKNQVI